ncbi:unnamed protein product [Polarella glacialis]|uniref:Uncharacterized protein n=1 Tax=Polarella glacialis TaxID=89957 RepID=A0A813D9C7_POLGL|nr:unnamed protein product [Polarella glacialis]
MSGVAASFYLDCSAGSMGIPEGLDPKVRCSSRSGLMALLLLLPLCCCCGACRTHTQDCARIRRALDTKKLLGSLPMSCMGERYLRASAGWRQLVQVLRDR